MKIIRIAAAFEIARRIGEKGVRPFFIGYEKKIKRKYAQVGRKIEEKLNQLYVNLALAIKTGPDGTKRIKEVFLN